MWQPSGRRSWATWGHSESIAAATNLSAQASWAEAARAFLGCRYDHGVQAGVEGQTSAQIAARVQNANVGTDWSMGDTVVAEAEILIPSAPSNLRSAAATGLLERDR